MNETRDFLMNPPEIEIPKKKKDLTNASKDKEFQKMIGEEEENITSARKKLTSNPFMKFSK